MVWLSNGKAKVKTTQSMKTKSAWHYDLLCISEKRTLYEWSLKTILTNISVAFWLVNVYNIKQRSNHDMRGNRDIFSGKSIYNRESISRQEHRISKYRIKI